LGDKSGVKARNLVAIQTGSLYPALHAQPYPTLKWSKKSWLPPMRVERKKNVSDQSLHLAFLPALAGAFFWGLLLLGQPVTPILVFWLIREPSWATNSVGIA
jgi:hypothetical protein